MAKKPYIEFYPGDWARDAGVRKLSLEEKGAWLEILIAMDDNDPRGELQGNVQGLSRLLGVEDWRGFLILDSLIRNKVPDIIWQNPSDEKEWDELCLNLSTNIPEMSAGIPQVVPFFWLTLRNRRMWRDEEEKRKWRDEKRRQREEKSDECPPNVTPSRARSSSSSSSSSSKRNIPKFTPGFLEAKKAYPPRKGNQNYPDAFKGWNAYLGQTIEDRTLTEDDLLLCCRNYHNAEAAAGHLKTEYVMQMSTFFGKDARFLEYLVVEKSCGTCTHGGPEPTYCIEAGATVNPDDTPCERHEEKNGTPATS